MKELQINVIFNDWKAFSTWTNIICYKCQPIFFIIHSLRIVYFLIIKMKRIKILILLEVTFPVYFGFTCHFLSIILILF